MKKRVGRPEVKASERRGETFRFVTTKEESAKIRGEAKRLHLTVSEYLRGVAIPRGER